MMSATSPNHCYFCNRLLVGQKWVWTCKKCETSWCAEHKKTHFKWNWLVGLDKEHCPNCKVLLKDNIVISPEFLEKHTHQAKKSISTRSNKSQSIRKNTKPGGGSMPSGIENYNRTQVNISALLEKLPVVTEVPLICRNCYDGYRDALRYETIGPVNIRYAYELTAKVHEMGDVDVADDAVIVSFRGHAVADGVAIWRTNRDEYHAIVWYDHLD
jgi:hypothetical protein